MKILIITDAWYPQINGVVRTYEHIIAGLKQRGHDAEVISPSDFTYTMPMPGYSEIRLALLPYRGMENKVMAYAPDSIHIATEGPLGWAARRVCLQHNLKFSTSYHTQFPDYVAKRVGQRLPFLKSLAYDLTKAYVRRFHAPAQILMVTTKSIAKQLKSWGFKSKIAPLTRGVETNRFYPAKEGSAKDLFKDYKQPVALYVGRVAIEKNISAFMDMAWTGTKVVVGDGPQLKELSEKYKAVRFVGAKEGDELAQYYREADIFVFPSKTDTFGIVLIEAMASGLPIAAYPVSGPIDVVTKDFLGVLDENLDKAAKGALALAMENGGAQKRAVFAKEHYSWDKATQQFEAVQHAVENKPIDLKNTAEKT